MVCQLFVLRIGIGLLSGYGTITPAIVAQVVSPERLGGAIGTLHALRTGTTNHAARNSGDSIQYIWKHHRV